jgi:hypothetical protein
MSNQNENIRDNVEIVQKLLSENLISGIMSFDESLEVVNTPGEQKDD